MTIILPSIESFKKEAQKLKKDNNIKMSHAYEVLARSYGFKTYAAFRVFIGAKK